MFNRKLFTVLLERKSRYNSISLLLKRPMSHKDLKEIFLKAVESVQPRTLIDNEVKLQSRHLLVREQRYPLHKPCYMVGFGKAVLGMATAMERVLGDHLKKGVVTVPVGIFEKYEKPCGSKIEYIEGAKNNLPDKNAERGALMIKSLAERLSVDDLLIVLISGGGSALLPLPVLPITLEQKVEVIKKLANRGANIRELNAVRRRLSVLKGGGLAEVAYPCRVVSLILSDIIGDPLDFIASGPTVPNTDPTDTAALILKKYALYEEIPKSVRVGLQGKDEGPGAPVPVTNREYSHVRNYIIGNNRLAAEAARDEAARKGFQSVIVSTEVAGDANEISEIYARLACNLAATICDPANKDDLKVFLQEVAKHLRAERNFIREVLDVDFARPICLIFAGEPTVVVTGSGKGGRNQHLALAFSIRLKEFRITSADVSFLSAGTDGIDGPTDAAGALAVCGDLEEGTTEEVLAEEYFKNNDSYGFYEKYDNGSHLIKTGHTGTNVMDIHLLTIAPRMVGSRG